jgi:hypothetical protein
MTTIAIALVVFGLALIFWAITASDARPARRATGAGVGITALLVGLFLGASRDRERGRYDWASRERDRYRDDC